MILVIDMSSREVLSSSLGHATSSAPEVADLQWCPESEGLHLATSPAVRSGKHPLATVLPAELLDVELEAFLRAMRSR